jgi:hypothetical protein
MPASVMNNKDLFVRMMGKAFENPSDHGLPPVADELPDFLGFNIGASPRSNFLGGRRSARAPVVSGLQESLFDNPRFSYRVDTMRRVKHRFEWSASRANVARVVTGGFEKGRQAEGSRPRAPAAAHHRGSMNERLDAPYGFSCPQPTSTHIRASLFFFAGLKMLH